MCCEVRRRYISVCVLNYNAYCWAMLLKMVNWPFSQRNHPVDSHMLKVKFTLEQSIKTQRGSRGIALLFL